MQHLEKATIATLRNALNQLADEINALEAKLEVLSDEIKQSRPVDLTEQKVINEHMAARGDATGAVFDISAIDQ
jgi:uncharacterized protein YlxW (UPF0749 family)